MKELALPTLAILPPISTQGKKTLVQSNYGVKTSVLELALIARAQAGL